MRCTLNYNETERLRPTTPARAGAPYGWLAALAAPGLMVTPWASRHGDEVMAPEGHNKGTLLREYAGYDEKC